MQVVDWGALLSGLTLVVVAVRELRAGLSAQTRQLVQLLQDTNKAQAERISYLEREQSAAREEIARLNKQIGELRETVMSQAAEIAALRLGKGRVRDGRGSDSSLAGTVSIQST